MSKEKKPFTQGAPFIAAVGALITAIVMAIGYAMEWPAEAYAIAAPIVAAGLAVWRTGVGVGSRRGAVSVEAVGVVAAFALLGVFALLLFSTQSGCSAVKTHAKRTTQIDVWPKSCRMTVDADGERVFSLTSDPGVKCALACPKSP